LAIFEANAPNSLRFSGREGFETRIIFSKGSFHERQAASLSRLVLASILG